MDLRLDNFKSNGRNISIEKRNTTFKYSMDMDFDFQESHEPFSGTNINSLFLETSLENKKSGNLQGDDFFDGLVVNRPLLKKPSKPVDSVFPLKPDQELYPWNRLSSHHPGILVKECLSSGSKASVYRCVDQQTSQEAAQESASNFPHQSERALQTGSTDSRGSLALKLKPNLPNKQTTIDTDQEVQILQLLNDHLKEETILFFPRIFEIWEEEKGIFISMQMYDSDLSLLINDAKKPSQPIAEADILLVHDNISQALKVLFEQGIVHMDIKPENIFISNENKDPNRDLLGTFPKQSSKSLDNPTQRYLLGDFGMSVQAKSIKEGFELVEGDSRYMPKEVLDWNLPPDYDPHSIDKFSLGMILLEMTTLIELPSGGDTWHKLRSDSIFLQNLLQGVKYSEKLKQLISSLLFPDLSTPIAGQFSGSVKGSLTATTSGSDCWSPIKESRYLDEQGSKTRSLSPLFQNSPQSAFPLLKTLSFPEDSSFSSFLDQKEEQKKGLFKLLKQAIIQ